MPSASANRFFLDLLAKREGVQRASGLMTYAGFELEMDRGYSGLDFFLTEDPTLAGAEDVSVNPAGGAVVSVPAVRDQALAKPGRAVFVADIPGVQVDKLQAVRRFGLVRDEVLKTVDTVKGALQVPGIETLRGQHTIRLHNVRRPQEFVSF